MSPLRLLYTSFDEVPGPKGASTHIEAFADALGKHYGNLLLLTPGPQDIPAYEMADGVLHQVLGCPDDNPIGRALSFRVKLMALLQHQRFDILHFRSIFEGYPLARAKAALGARLLYEVNGFPSIEMKYLYRQLGGDERLLAKLAQQELACLQAADRIVTISAVTQHFIQARLGCAAPLHVIPNGVELRSFPYQDPPLPDAGPLRLLYVGTLTAWQGIETLLTAVALVRRQIACVLRLIGPAPRTRRRDLDRLMGRLQLHDAVEFLGPQSHTTVCHFLHGSHAAIVPLLPVDRNTQQGCCPLKMLEAMAAGCPVIAADLPVVRALAAPYVHFLPTRPGHAKSLCDAIMQIATEAYLGTLLARRARQRIVAEFTWEHATRQLLQVYEQLLDAPVDTL